MFIGQKGGRFSKTFKTPTFWCNRTGTVDIWVVLAKIYQVQ